MGERLLAQLESAFQRTECCLLQSETSRRYRIESSETPPATVNFGGVTVLEDFDPTLAKAATVAVAAVAAALVAWFVATRILRIGDG